MRLVGWKSRQVVGRYRVDALAKRPRAEWLRLGDRLYDTQDSLRQPALTLGAMVALSSSAASERRR